MYYLAKQPVGMVFEQKSLGSLLRLHMSDGPVAKG